MRCGRWCARSIREGAPKPSVGVDGYLRTVAFRAETEPTDEELAALADEKGDICAQYSGHTERWTVAQIKEGRDWLIDNSLPVADFDRDRLRALIAALGKGNAPNTERRRWSTVKAVLNWAAGEVGPSGLPRCPAGLTFGLKVRGAERSSVEDVGEVPTVEEMWAFAWTLGLVAGPRFCALPTTLGGAGLRIGEAAALQRRNCEDDAATGGMWLTVRANLATAGATWTDGGTNIERRGTKGKGPKGNTKGRRTYLPPEEAAVLRTHLDLFVAAAESAPVFTTNGGSSLTVPHLQRDHWKPAREIAFPAPHRLANMNRHSLRHLACTRWLRSGVALTTAARWGWLGVGRDDGRLLRQRSPQQTMPPPRQPWHLSRSLQRPPHQVTPTTTPLPVRQLERFRGEVGVAPLRPLRDRVVRDAKDLGHLGQREHVVVSHVRSRSLLAAAEVPVVQRVRRSLLSSGAPRRRYSKRNHRA